MLPAYRPEASALRAVRAVLLSSAVSLRVNLSEVSEHRIRAYRKIIGDVDPLPSSRTAANQSEQPQFPTCLHR